MTMIVAMLVAALSFLADQSASVTGTWSLTLHGDHALQVPLVLEQEGTAVSGTITTPTQRGRRVEVTLSGEFKDGALAVSGTIDQDGDPSRLELKATLKDDGTLEGTATTPHGPMVWTAERLRSSK
jgi:hypothetical protein